MQPEGLTEQPSGPGPDHRVAELSGRNHPQTGLRTCRQLLPIRESNSRRAAPAACPGAPAQNPGFASGAGGASTTVSASRVALRLPSNRGQAFAAHPAAVGQGGLAALGRVAVQETVLPFAAYLRRLILALHKSVKLLWPGLMPCRRRENSTFRRTREDNNEGEGVKRSKLRLTSSAMTGKMGAGLRQGREAAALPVFSATKKRL